MKQRATGSTPVLATKVMDPKEITLALLISDWLKMRGLKWHHSPKYGYLEMGAPDDSWEPWVKINDDHVAYDRTVFLDTVRLNLSAADPEFFPKLERALRHEEKWAHALGIIKLIADAVHVTWQPMLGVVWDWFDNVCHAFQRCYRKLTRL